jgi:hypothetical protein
VDVDITLDDAVTGCPGCKKDVLLRESTCRHCGSAADTQSELVSFRRPDESTGLVDQKTLEFLRSDKPNACQADLDELFSKTTSVVFWEWPQGDEPVDFIPRLTIEDARGLRTLKESLAIDDGKSRHVRFKERARFEFYSGSELIAEIDLALWQHLRWKERWMRDGDLLDWSQLLTFLRDRGFGQLWEACQEYEAWGAEEYAKYETFRSTWEPLVPAGMQVMYEDFVCERWRTNEQILTNAHAILAKAYPEKGERILALFAWYGHAGDKSDWVGYFCVEQMPLVLLLTFESEELVGLLESIQLTDQHFEGVARLISHQKLRGDERAYAAFIEVVKKSPVLKKLVQYVERLGDEEKRRMFERGLGR